MTNDAERVSDIEPATNEIPRASEAEALASLREYATGPIKAVFTWSEAATVLELIETLTKSGIIEVAVRNPSVAEYMAHWEGRAERAEAIIEAQSKALAEASAGHVLIGYLDEHGHVSCDFDSPIKAIMAAIPDPPVGRKLVRLYAAVDPTPTPENPNG